MAGEIVGKILMFVLAAVAINQGIVAAANYDIIGALIPQYAKWVYIGAGAIGAWFIYGMFRG